MLAAVLVDLRMTRLLTCCEEKPRNERGALPGKNVVKQVELGFTQQLRRSLTCTLRIHGERLGYGMCW